VGGIPIHRPAVLQIWPSWQSSLLLQGRRVWVAFGLRVDVGGPGVPGVAVDPGVPGVPGLPVRVGVAVGPMGPVGTASQAQISVHSTMAMSAQLTSKKSSQQKLSTSQIHRSQVGTAQPGPSSSGCPKQQSLATCGVPVRVAVGVTVGVGRSSHRQRA
jgi:hypothetical protein